MEYNVATLLICFRDGPYVHLLAYVSQQDVWPKDNKHMFLTWKNRLVAVLGAVGVGGRGGFTTTVKVPYPSPLQTSFVESSTNVNVYCVQ